MPVKSLSACVSPLKTVRAYLVALIILLVPALSAFAGNDAAFVSQTVPTSMNAGQSYSVSVTMRNTGTTTWTDAANYHLGSQNPQDNQTWGTGRIFQPLNVLPGGQVTFAFVIKAPVPAAGTTASYNFQWQMVQDGVEWFGALSPNLSLSLTSPAAPPSTTPQVPVGGSASFSASDYGSVDAGYQGWTVYNAASQLVASTATPNAWAVARTASGFTVTAPSGATVGNNYTVSYGQGRTGSGENIEITGPFANFNVVTAVTPPPPPVTAPPPAVTGAPYSWQGSVGGVNSANGNKVTTVPLFGWTARGGLPVGFALTHNSLGGGNTDSGEPGFKWTTSYHVKAVLSGSNVTVGWGDGGAYTFVWDSANNKYVAPKGIYDTLTANSSGGSITSFDLKTKGQVTYHFNSQDGTSFFLGTVTDENGNQVVVHRDPASARVNSVSDPSGRTLTLTYDGAGRVNFARDDQSGRYWTIGYDGNGDLTSIQSPPGLPAGRPSMGFDYSAHNITAVHDLNGQAATFTYNGDSTLATATDPCLNQTQFAYQPNFVVTDPNGHQMGHYYVGGQLSTVVDGAGKPESYTYDASNNLISKTDRRGKVWQFGADPRNGDIKTATDPLGKASQTLYDARNSKPLQTVDPLGHPTTYVYDANGVNLQTVTDALGHTSSINNYWYGLPTSASDPLGHTVLTAYDADGNVTQVQDANGFSSQAAYNRAGWKLLSIDPLGDTTSFVYDAWGRVTAVNTPSAVGGTLYRLDYNDGVHQFLTASLSEYNQVRVSGATSRGPLGGVYTDANEAAGLTALYRLYGPGNGEHFYTTDAGEYNYLRSIGYSDEGVAGYVFTAPGPDRKPLYRLYNPSLNQHWYTDNVDEYNALGAAGWTLEGVRAYLANNTTTTAYDFNGNVLSVTDPNGHTATNTYDADNRVTSTTNGRQDTVHYYYDEYDGGGSGWRRGLLSRKVDGNGNMTAYAYTARNEPWWVTYADGPHEEFYYDENGALATHKDGNGGLTSYTYDDAGRLIRIFYPNTTFPNKDFGYDDADRQISMTDALGTTGWTYDAAGRLTQLTQPYGTLTYGYDAANRRTSMTEAGIGTWSYGYDAGGRLTSLVNHIGETTTFEYDAAGRLARQRSGPSQAMLTSFYFNDLGQRVSVNWGDPNNLTSMGWQYQTLNAGGQIMAVTDYQGNVSRFAYDGAGQLTGESLSGGWRPAYDFTYAYDSNGNRTSKRDNLTAQTDTYTYYANSDKLHNVFSASGQKGYTYDGAGNVLNVYRDVGGTQTLSWNPDGTLASYTDSGGTQAYGYNALGLRLSKSDGFVSQQVTDGTAPGAALLTDGRATYTPGVSESRAGGSRFYLPDARGTVHVALDAGYTAQDATYTDSFGNRQSGSGYNDPTPFGWGGITGYQQDASGLLLLGHRYYDPTTGRFLSQDPAEQGTNWYAYCDNDPLGKTDPSGMAAYAPPMGMYQASSEHMNVLMGGLMSSGWDEGSTQDIMDAQLQQNYQVEAQKAQQASSSTFSFASFGIGLAGIDGLKDLVKVGDKLSPGNGFLASLSTWFTAVSMAGKATQQYEASMSLFRSGWSLFSTMQQGGAFIPMGTGMMARGGLALAGGAASAAGAAIFAGLAGWTAGTAISNLHVGPGGQSVSDYWADAASGPDGLGTWMWEHTSFGH